MMRHPLLLVLIATAGFSLACMPPTTYGLRSSGELSEPGTGGVGGGIGVSEDGLTLLSLDGDYAINDNIGVAGAVGYVAGAGQAQAEVRFSSEREAPFGVSGMAGVAGVAGLVTAGGPYVGGTVRAGDPERGFVYGGGKVNAVYNLGLVKTWAIPTVGIASAGGRWRYGGEVIYFQPLGYGLDAGGFGGQVYVRRQLGE